MRPLSERAVQRVDRNEIIPVDHKNFQSIATDPATGLPYNFIFVNNLSHSLGTFESPYPSLSMAESPNSHPGDIIYVFEGDGTSNNMDEGFMMQNYQHLWGSGVEQRLWTNWGMVTVPAFTFGLPLVTNSAGGSPVITFADGCEISGIHVLNSSESNYGISYPDPGNPSSLIIGASIHNNQIDMNGGSYGIYARSGEHNTDDSSSWSIYQNTINEPITISSYGIFAQSGGYNTANDNSSWSIYQNTIISPISAHSAGIYAQSGGHNTADDNSSWRIYQNTINGAFDFSYGIFAQSGGHNTANDNSSWDIHQNINNGNVSINNSSAVIFAQSGGYNTADDNSSWGIYQNTINGAIGISTGIFAQSGGHNTADDNSSWSIYYNTINGIINASSIGIDAQSGGHNTANDNSSWSIYYNTINGTISASSVGINAYSGGHNTADDNSSWSIYQNTINGPISDGIGISGGAQNVSVSGLIDFSLIDNFSFPYPIQLNFNNAHYELTNYNNNPAPIITP